MKRRVVVTGLGAVTPVGNTVDEMWESLINGKSGIDYITLYDTTNMRVKIAAEVKNFNPDLYLEPKEAKRLDRAFLFGVSAAVQAYQDAKLEGVELNRDRFGVFVTSGIGGLTTIQNEAIKVHEKGGDRVSPFFVPNSIINLIGGNIAIKFQAHGPALAVVTACASGTNSIGEAFRYIRDGYMDIAFTGGAEAAICELGIGGFTTMRALNLTNEIDAASIPFDKRHSGFVMGEGAGILILEEYEHAIKRGAKIYAEMVGYHANCDAYHVTAPDETATGIMKCMLGAIEDAHIQPHDIDYINPHGTSTPLNDKYETLGIKRAFQDHAYKVLISGTKSMTGHSLGATGAIEAIITIKTITDGIIPPTINLLEQDDDCDLNYVPNHAVQHDVTYALSNSIGFGGHNATLVFKKI